MLLLQDEKTHIRHASLLYIAATVADYPDQDLQSLKTETLLVVKRVNFTPKEQLQSANYLLGLNKDYLAIKRAVINNFGTILLFRNDRGMKTRAF